MSKEHNCDNCAHVDLCYQTEDSEKWCQTEEKECWLSMDDVGFMNMPE